MNIVFKANKLALKDFKQTYQNIIINLQSYNSQEQAEKFSYS